MILPFLATFLINLVIGLAISVAASLIQNALAQNRKQAQPGVRGDIQIGGDNPLAFIMGLYATGGQLEYAGTWGTAGGTPNAYFVKVVSVSDLPVRGLAGFFVNGERVTLGETPHADYGYPVLEYRVGSKDHLWVKFYDGTQTVADAYLVGKFGSDPDRPWLSDQIGRGVAYFIATALTNRELFPGFPDYLAEIDGIALDDPRDGEQEDENPAIGIYTLLQGLSYDGDWVYGPQGITAAHLVGFDAQMDKCDAAVSLAAGGSEKRFRFGYEVTVDTEPHVVVGEYLKACNGRIAEIGGRYKLLVGEPDEAVVSFTDEDIVITSGQSFDPFPGLEGTFNAITATYPEPVEAWGNKDAPPRYRSDLEALDDDRRLPFSQSYPAVPFADQAQRLMRTEIEDHRRFRRHSHTAPPEWFEYEPLDNTEWTSAHNGYDAKEFLITVMDDLPNGNQIVGIHEIDPADYAWSTDYELPFDTTPIVAIRPPPQPMTGWQVEPYTFLDGDSNALRPGIEVLFAGELEDVRAVRVVARLAATAAVIFDGEIPYDPEVETPSIVLQGTFIRATQYEVRGRFLPFSGRETEWSEWLAVTTPDVGPPDLDARLDGWLQQLDTTREAALAHVLAALDERIDQLGQTTAGLVAILNEYIDQSIVNYIGTANSNITEVRTVADGLADMFINVFAGNDITAANALFRMTSQILEEDDAAGVSIALEARANVGELLKKAGLYIDVFADEHGGLGRVRVVADQVLLETPDGVRRNALLFASGETVSADITVEGSDNVVRLDLRSRIQNHKMLLTDDAEVRAPIGTPMSHSLLVQRDGTGSRTLDWETPPFIDPPPVLSAVPNSINPIRIIHYDSNPLRLRAALDGDPFIETAAFVLRDSHQELKTSSSNTQIIFSLSAFDFVPGSLIVGVFFGHRSNSGGDFGSDPKLDNNTPIDWSLITSAADSSGAIASRWRINSFWKIADGSEVSFQPMVFSSSGGVGTLSNTVGMQIFAYDFLGGAFSLLPSPTADARFSGSAHPEQTVPTSGVKPSIAFSVAGLRSSPEPGVPDQVFSGTPDDNFALDTSGGLLKMRTKQEWFAAEDTPGDITTSYDPANTSAFRHALMSFGFKVE